MRAFRNELCGPSIGYDWTCASPATQLEALINSPLSEGVPLSPWRVRMGRRPVTQHNSGEGAIHSEPWITADCRPIRSERPLMHDPLIEFQNVAKSYRGPKSNRVVLRNFT